MSGLEPTGDRLDRPVDMATDHVLGAADASLSLVEYGSYACPHCRAANERIVEVRRQFGDALPYVCRHRPITGSDLAKRAAELVERAESPEEFWAAHVALMTRSDVLTEDDLVAVADEFALLDDPADAPAGAARAERARVERDIVSARASGVQFTPSSSRSSASSRSVTSRRAGPRPCRSPPRSAAWRCRRLCTS